MFEAELGLIAPPWACENRGPHGGGAERLAGLTHTYEADTTGTLLQEFIGFLDSRLKSEDLEKAGVKLVIIGCGEWEYIKPYRDLLQTPFPIYADPTKQTYIALGMTMRTLDAGKETPEYVKTTALGNVMMSIGKALKMGRILGNPGDIKQLGGEFVLGPGNTCSYVRRMENTRGHSPLAELLAAAGVESSS